MNQFEKQLEKWNNGVLRGAQAKLARILKVSSATVALWTTGKRNPSKGYIEQMAALFGISAQAVRQMLGNTVLPPIAYPESPTVSSSSHTLRENALNGHYATRPALPAQSNSVALPLLTAVTPDNAPYEDSDVIEWWTLPRQRVQGAKFLFQLPGNGPIVAVKPGITPQTALCLVQHSNGSYSLKEMPGTAQNKENKIIGTAIFVLTQHAAINY